MADRLMLADRLAGSETEVLAGLGDLLTGLTRCESFEFLVLMEDSRLFKNRLPLRLKIYAFVAQTAQEPAMRLIALVRLLRRMGSRTDLPGLGEIPDSLNDFAEYLAGVARALLGKTPLAEAVGALAHATRAFRAGDLNEMRTASDKGLEQLDAIPAWANPPSNPELTDLLIAETGHELTFIAANAAFRSGNIERARNLAQTWSDSINAWESSLGPLDRTRYQYYQLAGHVNYEVGLPVEALKAYAKALDYAPTPYRKAFLWMSMAQVERELGLGDQSWEHGVAAVEAWLASPYPQTAGSWIAWLSLEARTPEKRRQIESLEAKRQEAGGVEINRVSRAMTELYRLLADLHYGADPAGLVPRLDAIIDDLEKAGSWPNLVTLLATRAVVAGRLSDRNIMDQTIAKARELISTKLAADARPPAQFFLESAHALALRDVGAYDEAFHTLFERALEARGKYPGGVGPEEQTALEALYYLGALAGYDPGTIERRVRSTMTATA